MREFKDKAEFTCLMSCLPMLHLTTNKMVPALLLRYQTSPQSHPCRSNHSPLSFPLVLVVICHHTASSSHEFSSDYSLNTKTKGEDTKDDPDLTWRFTQCASIERPNRTIKISVYNILSLCLQQFGYVFAESVCKPMVTSIMEDLRVTEQKVTDMAPTEVRVRK
jgi:hypothetical protein